MVGDGGDGVSEGRRDRGGESRLADPDVLRRLAWLTRALAIAVGGLGAVVLVVGWGLGFTAAVRVAASTATMKANTALCFALAAAALWLLREPDARGGRRAAAMAAAAAVATIGLLSLGEDLFRWSLGIDELWFRDPYTGPLLAPGRMSPASAACFAFSGAALAMLSLRSAEAAMAAQLLALLAFLGGLLSVAGHVYGAHALYQVPAYASMALHTAIGFMILTFAIVCSRPDTGPMRIVGSATTAGALTRRLLPAVLVVLPLLAWLRQKGEERGLYQTQFGRALLVVANIVCLGAIVWLVAGRLLGAELARRAEQEALRRSEAHKATMVASALDGIISMDKDGRVTDFNPAAERMFGFARAGVLGKMLAELIIPPHLRDAHTAGLARYLATGEKRLIGRRVELPAVTATGDELVVELAILAVGGADPSFTAFLRDLTEQKRAEQLRARAGELEADNRRIQDANRIKSEFLANMSHELRTPLNAIIGFAQLLHDQRVGSVSPEQQEFLGDILSSSRHLLQLINDVLDLSKVEARKMEFFPEPVDLAKLVGDVTSLLRSMAAARSVQLTSEVGADLGTVTIDPSRLTQVLYNYLSNAIKFTPAGGTVTARAAIEDATTFRVEVQDSGVGIAPAEVARLFGEFQQLDGAARTGTGTGLGLALTKRLVEAQGGSVGVTSVLGAGSTFFALLPRAAHGRAALPEPRSIAATRPDAPVVLVVDDDPHDQDVVVTVLVEAGYAVETAATRAQALARCRERTFDAVTLDLLLPDASGLAVLEGIRGGARNHDVPVIVVSVVAERAMGFPLDDALSKPLDPQRLLASLRRAGVPPEREGRILVVDDDLGSRTLMETTLAQLGYRTTGAGDGASGLAEARAARPLAIVLDLVMPGMNGLEFLERFRSVPDNRDVPVIVWTIKELSPQEERALGDWAQSVVRKSPAGIAALVAELEARRRRS